MEPKLSTKKVVVYSALVAEADFLHSKAKVAVAEVDSWDRVTEAGAGQEAAAAAVPASDSFLAGTKRIQLSHQNLVISS